MSISWRRLRVLLNCTFGAILIGFAAIVPIKLAAGILFLGGSLLSMRTVLLVLNDRLYLRLPSAFLRSYSTMLSSWLTVGIFLNPDFRFFLPPTIVLGSHSLSVPSHLFRAYTFFGVILGILILPMLMGAMWFFFERIGPRFMARDVATGSQIGGLGRTCICFFEPGAATTYGRRVLREIRMTFAQRGAARLMAFVSADSYRRLSEKTEDWVCALSPMLLIFVSSESQDEQTDEQFAQMINTRIDNATGRVYLVIVQPYTSTATLPKQSRGIDVIRLPIGQERSERSAISSLLGLLATDIPASVIPIGDADECLSPLHRALISDVGRYAWLPLAEAYRGIRIARSNVERFLIALETTELMIRLSTACLMSVAWQMDLTIAATKTEWLRLPTFGNWVSALKRLIVAEELPSTHPVVQQVRQSYIREISAAKRRLITQAESIGLSSNQLPVSTELEWLDWILWLRNVTRGHGAVDELRVATLWPLLHEALLETIDDSELTVIQSKLTTTSAWHPGGWQTGTPNPPNDEVDASPEPVYVEHENDRFTFSIYPFLIVQGERFGVWNGVRGKAVEYLDYASGEMFHVSLESTDPKQLWIRSTDVFAK